MSTAPAEITGADWDGPPWWFWVIVAAVLFLLCSSCGLHCECHHSSRPNLAPITFPTNRVP